MKKIERIAALEQRVAALETAALEAKIGVAEDKPKLAVGQVWKMRNGEKVTITESQHMGQYWRTHPWLGVTSCGEPFTFSDEGKQALLTEVSSDYDLVELLSDAPTQKVEKKAEAGTHNVLPRPYHTPPTWSYWVPHVLAGSVEEFPWDDDKGDNRRLEMGLAFKTEEDAKIALNAILSFLKENTKYSD